MSRTSDRSGTKSPLMKSLPRHTAAQGLRNYKAQLERAKARKINPAQPSKAKVKQVK